MSKIYKDCWYCGEKIEKKPVIDKHQGRISIRCPYDLRTRGGWKDTVEAAIHSWNADRPEENEGLLNHAEFFSAYESSLLDYPEHSDAAMKNLSAISSKKYRIKTCWSQRQMQFTGSIQRKDFTLRREYFSRAEREKYAAAEN